MITISHRAYLVMLAHCQSLYPQEACGFLAGRGGVFTAVYAIENALHSRITFEMDARQQLEVMIDAEQHDLDSMAIYHSHPHGPPRPSVTDLKMAYYPDWPQLIISLQLREAPEVHAFSVSKTGAVKLDWQLE